jgi:hypothetical protein
MIHSGTGPQPQNNLDGTPHRQDLDRHAAYVVVALVAGG